MAEGEQAQDSTWTGDFGVTVSGRGAGWKRIGDTNVIGVFGVLASGDGRTSGLASSGKKGSGKKRVPGDLISPGLKLSLIWR